MKAYHPKSIVLTLLFALMVISCDDGSHGTLTAGGGIGGTGNISRGAISAFGSIVVNGTAFDTSDAVIIEDGEEVGVGDEVAQNNLDIGMVVTVEGTGGEDDAIADRVTYRNNVEGPVESIDAVDPSTREIVILGQTVVVNVNTEFKGVTFETIAEDDVVEISGFFDDAGAIWATFFEKTGEFTAGLVVEVQGFVVNLDAGLETFEINDLTVDYSLADINGLPGGALADGLLVEVEGTLDISGGQMLATEIELAGEVEVEDADQIEVTGFVTDFVSVFEFTVGDLVVEADEDTEFVDGTAEDVALGVKLEAEGSLENGVLIAEEIEFWEPDQIEVEGLVTNDALAPGEFTVGDQVVQTDAETVYEDGTPDDIALGVNIEIKGVPVDIIRSILIADKVSFEED